ncbi:hypothetical protein LWM68_40845 [Niabella sp. W65]|nr:hypothetical protein [Niabella sp. W65]MCH7368521.1 hypothetical protein [Niabella sp. W65]ULT44112.1 hypothetical protein KRR40_12550 [Niabella sp. I65]
MSGVIKWWVKYITTPMKWAGGPSASSGDKPARYVADGKRVDEWMIKFSYLHKKLNKYTFEELPKLVSQFEAFYKSTLKK